MTNGDALSSVEIIQEIEFHKSHGRLATMTVVQPPGRFGAAVLDKGKVTAFEEKPSGGGGYINGGFFIMSPKALDFIDGDETAWEREPLERLVAADQLAAFTHDGFWQPMDTVREREILEAHWGSGQAPWKVWS